MKAYIVSVALLFTSFFSIAQPYDDFEAVNTPIAEFVRWFSNQSNKTIVLGHGVTGAVTVNAKNLTSKELAPFFNSVLTAHGYKLDSNNGFLTVVVDAEQVIVKTPPQVRLYRLNNVRNTKITELMSSMLRATETTTNSKTEQQIQLSSVEVLPTTNAIIVTASAEQLQTIDRIIEAIDRPQQQIFIEGMITEVELGNANDLGVDITAALGSSGFELVTNTLNSFDKAKDNHLIYDGGDFNALVKAVYSSEDTNLLSRPNILIMDRERGYITVGQNVPFLTATEITDGGNTIQQIERKDVGVSLSVTPHITGDNVILVINQESSSVSNSAIAADIITNKRTLQTVVKVANGQTISLGGLISNEERESVSGVPVLMDIPWIGGLFRSTSIQTTKKELKVVIKTTVI